MSEEIIGRAIYKLDADVASLDRQLDAAASKVRGVTREFDDQQKKISDLIAKEKNLLTAREKASNPQAILRYNKLLKDTKTDIENARKSLASMADAGKKVGDSLFSVGGKAREAGNQIKNAFDNTNINAAKEKISGLGNALIGALAGFSVLEVGKQMISVTAEFEKFEAVLTNSLGDKSLAQKSLADIKDFAAKTPFSVRELTEGFVKLTNQGFKPTMSQMRSLGDIASSTGKGFDQLTEAILDAQTFEFERLKEFGIKVRQEGDKLRVTFKGQTDTIDKTSEAVRKYILGLGDASGVSGSMAAISETLGGQISNLGDQWDSFLSKLGEETKPAASAAITALNILLEGVSGVAEGIGELLTANIGKGDFISGIEDAGGSKGLAEKLFGSGLVGGSEEDVKKKNEIFADAIRQQKFYTEALEKTTDVEKKYKQFRTTINNEFEAAKKKFDEGTISLQEYNIALLVHEDTNKQLDAIYKRLQPDKEKDKTLTHEQKEAIKKANAEREKEIESLEKLRKQLQSLKDDGEKFSIDNTFKGEDLINKQFDFQKKKALAALEDQRNNLSKDFKNKKNLSEAIILLDKITAQTEANITAQRNAALKKFYEEQRKTAIEAAKAIADAQIDLAEILGETDSETFRHRYEVAEKYYNDLIDLSKQYGKSETEIQKLIAERDLALARLRKQNADRLKKEKESVESEEERHILEMMRINEEGERKILQKQLEFAKEKLQRLKEDNKSTLEERLRAENEVIELETRLGIFDKEKQKEKLLNALDGIKQVVDATLDGLQTILDAEIHVADMRIQNQERQVQKAREIADKGNAEILELEEKRLNDLTKKKEKYVRQQQALALIELAINSAVAISKAAAEGGAAAPFTITATLIALTAGIIKARQMATQAAFFKGGEFEGGFTGEGNPHDVSTTVDGKSVRKPYTFHKNEFIFNHEKTSKYRPIFRQIHEGKINLNEWAQKVETFEEMKRNPFIYHNLMPLHNGNAISDEKGHRMLSDIHRAITEQERLSVSIDERGIHAIAKRLKMRGDVINRLAR